MAKWKRYWREAVVCFLLIAFLALLSWWLRRPPQTSFGRFLCFGGILLDAFWIWRVLRSLWRNKWRQYAEELMQKAFERVSRGMERFFSFLCRKFGVSRKQRDKTLGGKTRITFDTRLFEREEKTTQKARKWKHLENDRERLGYLYRHMISQKMRAGTKIYRYETPDELRGRCENREEEEELFAYYPDHRYDVRREVNGDVLEDLKERFHVR